MSGRNKDTDLNERPDAAVAESGRARRRREKDTDLGYSGDDGSPEGFAADDEPWVRAPWDDPGAAGIDAEGTAGAEDTAPDAPNAPGTQGVKGSPETEGSQGAQETKEPGRRKVSDAILAVLSGNILSKSEVRRAYPFMVLVAVLMFLYIANVFRTQYVYREHTRLTEQVKELRAKSMTIASEKMKATRQSRIMVELDQRGIPLRESLRPNKVIPKGDE